MDRVCLIIPPSPFLADERVFVSLGILKVAACLEQAGYPVDVLDLSGVENYGDVLANYANNSGVNRFGVTVTTPQCPAAERITNKIREAADGRRTRIIWGGPHVTVVNAAKKLETKRGTVGRAHKAFARIASVADVLVAGDGEQAIFEALETNNKLVDADDPGSWMFLNEDNIISYPFPARHLVDIKGYKYNIDGVPASSIIAQLGCPFGCLFCSGRLSPSFRRIRTRNIQNVLLEIREIHCDYGFEGIQWYDDELNVNPNFTGDLKEIIKLRQELGVDFHFRGFLKANLFNENQASLMREAGFRQVCIGFESGSPRILKNIKKAATVDDNTSCMEIAHKYNIKVKAFMSIGHAGESYLTIEETRNWLLKVQPDDFDCTIITTYPGTPYYDFAFHADWHNTWRKSFWTYVAPNNDKLYSDDVDFVSEASYYKGIIDGGYKSFVWTDYINAEDLVKMRNWLERDVRNKLGIPFYPVIPASRFEASMGQLPGHIYRRSDSR